MKTNKLKYRLRFRDIFRIHRKGFTLPELLVGSVVMLVVVLGALSMYSKSNQIAVNQNQYAELQHDVRSSMYLVSRDIRSAGVGFSSKIAGHFLQGFDGFGPGGEGTDSIRLWGNYDDQLNLNVDDYKGGEGGGSATVKVKTGQIHNFPYPCPDYLEGRQVLVISTKGGDCTGCIAFRYIGFNKVKGCRGVGEEQIVFAPGMSDMNPPGGLVSEDEPCGDADCWDDAIITIGDIKQYWLDTTGNPADYTGTVPDLTPENGYLGIPNTLYVSTVVNEGVGYGTMLHLPLAQNIEDLQFQFNGDADNDGQLDGFMNWQDSWTGDIDLVANIRQIRMWVVGVTPKAYTGLGDAAPSDLAVYQKPAIAGNSAGTYDKHKRFVLETVMSVRNMSTNMYNTGTR